VDVIQVPKDPARLIDTFLEIEARFPSGSSRNLKNYRLRSQAKALEESASNLEDYIKSLDINVFVHKNNEVHSSRVSELSKKSNQFNVTTKRYEVGEILTLMRSDNIDVYCFEVSDIFGNSGITGVIIIELQDSLAKVDSFFMSCRILGRRIEFYVWEAIMSEILSQGCGEIRAEYIKTERNEMAASFFQDLGFSITGGDRKFCTSYGVCADDLPLPMPKLMEVTIGH
jgi:FkbH-like protein